ncbi:hypothetical protein KIW84_054073 [Lathyrus oleraceus]|nr:hypothetical protein KIW84_054073 [Pisum sativum]
MKDLKPAISHVSVTKATTGKWKEQIIVLPFFAIEKLKQNKSDLEKQNCACRTTYLKPSQTAHKDVEVVPVSSTLPPEPPVSVAVESQPPILPLPVTSRPTHRDLQVKSSPPVQPTAPTNARPVMPFPLPGQRTVKLAREN